MKNVTKLPKFLIVISIVSIVAISGLFILESSAIHKSGPNPVNKVVNRPEHYPNLPNTYSWSSEEILQTDSDYHIYSDSDSLQPISVGGTQYKTSISNIQTKEQLLDIGNKFTEYYEAKTKDAGVYWNANWRNNLISAEMSDGAILLTHSRGYIYLNEDNASTLVLRINETTKLSGTDPVTEGPIFDCPCSVELTVFESDPVHLPSYIKE